MKNLTAKFIHECDDCTFLGHKDGYDLYVCRPNDFYSSFIARYADSGWSYVSIVNGMEHIIPLLAEAKKRAIELGLLKKDEKENEI